MTGRLIRHEMVDRVAGLAAVLRDLGMQEGDRVAMSRLTAIGTSILICVSGAAESSFPSIRALPREMIEQVRDANRLR